MELLAAPVYALPFESLSEKSLKAVGIEAVLVEVLPLDLASGRPNDGFLSPVGIAMRRACAQIPNPLDPDELPGLRFFVTPRAFCLINEGDERNDVALRQAVQFARQFELPMAVRRWISDYDHERLRDDAIRTERLPRFWLCFDPHLLSL